MPFALKISFQNIFIKHFIYGRPATYRLEVCNLVRKVMVKISHKNCKNYLVKPTQEILCVGVRNMSFWNIFQRECVLKSP